MRVLSDWQEILGPVAWEVLLKSGSFAFFQSGAIQVSSSPLISVLRLLGLHTCRFETNRMRQIIFHWNFLCSNWEEVLLDLIHEFKLIISKAIVLINLTKLNSVFRYILEVENRVIKVTEIIYVWFYGWHCDGYFNYYNKSFFSSFIYSHLKHFQSSFLLFFISDSWRC